MDHITVPDGEIRDCPQIIDLMIQLASKDRSALPCSQGVETVRSKLRQYPFLSLMTLFNQWQSKVKGDVFNDMVNDLYPA